jgi:hypothetical protein
MGDADGGRGGGRGWRTRMDADFARNFADWGRGFARIYADVTRMGDADGGRGWARIEDAEEDADGRGLRTRICAD